MASSATLRHINQARVLDALRQESTLTRVELATMLGLQRSTITVITGALIEDGLVHELDSSPNVNRSSGRPAVGLALSGSGAYFAGLDLGNEMSTAIVVNLNGEEIGRASAATDSSQGAEAAEDALIALLHEAMADQPDALTRLQGVGITVPGVVSGNVIEWALLLGWRDTPFGHRVAAAFGVPVLLDNDANAAAVSEAQFGAGRDARDLLYVLLDRGVGVGVILNRTIFRGSIGRVGEAGHIRIPTFGTHPSTWPLVEDMVGMDALRSAYADGGGTAETMEAFLDELLNGAPEAESATRTWEEQLAWFTSSLIWILAPELVVFGGRASAVLKAHSLTEISSRLEAPQMRTRLAISAFGTDAVVMGAASLPMGEFFALPLLRPEQAATATRHTAEAIA